MDLMKCIYLGRGLQKEMIWVEGLLDHTETMNNIGKQEIDEVCDMMNETKKDLRILNLICFHIHSQTYDIK